MEILEELRVYGDNTFDSLNGFPQLELLAERKTRGKIKDRARVESNCIHTFQGKF